MSQPRSSQSSMSPWLWIIVGALVIAVLAVWGTIALRDLGGDAQATPSTSEPSSDTPDDPTDDPADELISLTEPSGARADTAALWMPEPPPGFTLDDPDPEASGIHFTSVPGCTITLTSSGSQTEGDTDAAATEAAIAEISSNLDQINDDFRTVVQPSVVEFPVGEDGSGGTIEFLRFGTEFVVVADDTPTQSSTVLRAFHDLDLVIMLTYTCGTADAEMSFDDLLDDAGLWFEP